MKPIEREKMCISCEGRIALDAEVCPYCATQQSERNMHNSFQAPIFQHQSLEDSLTSLYTPPYQGKRPQFSLHTQDDNFSYEQETSLYKTPQMERESTLVDFSKEEEEAPSLKSSLLPIAFLLSGMHLLILGLMQLFFSKNGVLRLEWNANYWFFYCLFGIPLLYFGYKKVKNL